MNLKQAVIFNILSALVMSIVMSFAMTWISAGISPASEIFLPAFLSGCGIGFLVALPASFLFIAPLQKFVMKKVK